MTSENTISATWPLHEIAPTAKPDAQRKAADIVSLSRSLSNNLEAAQMMPYLRDLNRPVISAVERKWVVVGGNPHESCGDVISSEGPMREGPAARVRCPGCCIA